MATYVNPFSWSAVETAGELAQTYYIDSQIALMRLAESMNPLELGMITFQGMIGGRDSDTLRVADQTNLAGQSLSALASETDVPVTVSHVMGYTDCTVAWRGLSREQTYGQQIFSGDMVAGALSVEAFLAMIGPMTWKTMRGLACTAGAGISASVGSSAAQTSYDVLLTLAAAWNADAYSALYPGLPKLTLHPTQWEHVKASCRVEPGLQMNGAAIALQGLEQSQFHADPLGLGLDVVTCADVTTASSAFQGFITDPGGVGVCFGDTGRIRPSAGVTSLALPQIGAHWQEISDGARQGIRIGQIRQLVGVTIGSVNVFRAKRVLGALT